MKHDVKLGVIASADKPKAVRRAGALMGELAARGTIVADNLADPARPDIAAMQQCDYIIVLGGDGTILSTVRQLGEHQVPLIGVNMGKLGFLAEFTVEELLEQFDRIVNEKTLISRRVLLNCKITGPEREDWNCLVVNELALIAGPPFRMIEVSMGIGDEELVQCAGDGLIVATPTGSTAYNLSAGGPILESNLRAAVITPLAPHSLGFRPMVIALDRPIHLRYRSGRQDGDIAAGLREAMAAENDAQPTLTPTKTSAVVMIDGQTHTPVGPEDRITISAFDKNFALVHHPLTSRWALLKTKLHWATLPSYQ